MKLLLDQGVSRGAARVLRERGVDAVHASESNLAAASDRELLDLALLDGGIIVTLDADFHAILALSSATQPSVVRIERLRGAELADLVEKVLATCGADLRTGASISVDARAIRVRLRPLAK